jgi:hypothetical protein
MLTIVLVVLRHLDKRAKEKNIASPSCSFSGLLHPVVVEDEDDAERTKKKKKATLLSSDVDKASSSSISTERHREKNVECERRKASSINEM